MPALVDIPGVELARVGTFRLSSGTTTFTAGDFTAAIEARSTCAAIGRPILKQGHVDPRYDGQPALGWVDFEGVTGDGTLMGTYRGVPDALGAQQADGHSVLASAYPTRSIEGFRNYRCSAGHTHPFVITGVALLGATKPGVDTLQDLPAMYGIAAAEEPRGDVFGDVPLKTPVRVITGDEIAATQATSAPAGEPSDKEGIGMTPDAIREQVGLPATATDEEVSTRLTELVTKFTEPEVKPEPPAVPADVDQLVAASVEKALTPVLAALTSTSSELAEIKAARAADDKASFFAAALADGKVTPKEVEDTYAPAWDENRTIVEKILAAKAPGSAMPIRAAGYKGNPDSPDTDLTEADEAFLKGL